MLRIVYVIYVMDKSLQIFLAHVESVKAKSGYRILDDFGIHLKNLSKHMK